MAKIYDILGLNWIKEKLDTINRKLDVILIKMEGGRNVSPELERAIKEASARAHSIDQKVP